MKIKLQEFKNAVQLKISGHLDQNCEPIMRNNAPKRFVVCKNDDTHIGFLLDLEQGTCTWTKDVDTIKDVYKKENSVILFEQLSEDEQQHIVTLLYHVIMAENGFDLWKNINLQLDQMPGWWSMFSSLRPLTIGLRELLKQFQVDELKAEDDRWVTKILEALKERVNELLQLVNELKQRCNQLEIENVFLKKQVSAGLISQNDAQQLIHQQTATLLASKNEILTELNELKQENKKILDRNQVLEDKLSKFNADHLNMELEHENERLHWQLTQLLEKVKTGSLQIDKVVASVHSKEKVDKPSKPAVSSKLEFESESLSSKEFNERYKKLRQQSGSANRRDRFWRTNSSDSILSLSRKTVDECQSPSSVFN